MKASTLVWTWLLLSSALWATDCIPNGSCETDWTLEVRGSYYQITSKKFAKVYTKHLLDYQVEVAKRVYPFCELWAGVYWASKEGHLYKRIDALNDKVKYHSQIFILPINLGLKLIYPLLPCVDVYAGVGGCYSFLRIKNVCKKHHFSFSPLKKVIYKDALGAIFKLGLQIALSDSTFLDIFSDYYHQRFHFSHQNRHLKHHLFRHHLDCSGFKWGIGLGVYF